MDYTTLLKIAVIVFVFALPIYLVWLLIRSNRDN